MFRSKVTRTPASRNAGFTLIEIAIVVVISAILLSAVGGYLNNAMMQSKSITTNARLADIQAALKDYVARNNRLPKPAPRNAALNAATYAREITGAATAPGVLSAAGAGGQVLIGMIPTRTINLPDEYGYDGWKNRIVYVVTDSLTQTSTFDLSKGAISIIDSAGNSMITPSGSGTFLLLSPGPDHEDGYSPDGIRVAVCSTGQYDSENCDGDSVFRDTLSVSDVGATQFDDYLDYEANFNKSFGLPAGAVMAFNLSSCPPGWTTITNMAGRVIVGSGSYSEPSLPPTASSTTFTPHTYAVGDESGFATRYANTSFNGRINNMPPHKAFLYCEKTGP